VPIDLVYLDLGGTVVELISYEGVNVDPAPEKEHLGYRMIALEVDDMLPASREFGIFRDEFAADSPLQRRVFCEPDFLDQGCARAPGPIPRG